MSAEEKYSINTGNIRTFSPADYALFSIVLILSAVIGMYYAFKDRHRVTTKNFMVGDKSLNPFPVAMSLAVTYFSAMSLLGNPVEIYRFNTMFWYMVLALTLAVAGAAHIFMPFFYRLKVTTVFEYLEMRFNTPVRIIGTVVLILQTLPYFSFLLYTPSLALSSVTDINLWGSVVGMGVLVTFYTTLGGMKAVVWTDTLQAAVMLAGFLAVIIRGSAVVGGFEEAWKIADSRGRVKFDDFSADPSTRHSFWTVTIGGAFFWMSLYGVNQAQVQRCLACRTVRQAQVSLWLNLLCIALIMTLTFMSGIVMFAFYADCHPMGIITKVDQLLPLFVMDTLTDYPGAPGIFVACIFSGSLSSLSSGLSAISAVTVKDYILPYCCTGLSDFKTTMLTKFIVVLYGGIGMTFAYLVSNLQSVLQAIYSLFGLLNGQLFGLFAFGMFFPWANSFGAFVGCLVSLFFMAWVSIGTFWHKVSTATPSNTTTVGCRWNLNTNVTMTTTTASSASTMLSSIATTTTTDPTDIPAYEIYTLSYLWYTITGAMVLIVVGLICSFISGHTKPSSLDPRLICPLFDHVFPFLPECILKPLRFGIVHTDKYKKYDDTVKQFEEDITTEVQITAEKSDGVWKTSASRDQANMASNCPPSAHYASDNCAFEPDVYNTKL